MRFLKFLFGSRFSKDSFYSWFILGLSFSIISLNCGFFFSTGNVFVALQRTYSLTREETAQIINALTIPFYIAGLFTGPLLKTFGFRKTALFGIILNLVGLLLASRIVLSNRSTWFMICFPLIGSSAAILHPACGQSTFAHFEKFRGNVSSILMLSNTAAAVIFSTIFDHVFTNHGLACSFTVIASISAQCLVLVALFREYPKPTFKQQNGEQQLSLINDKKLPESNERTFLEDLGVFFKNYKAYSMITSMCFGFVAFTTLLSTIIDLATDNGLSMATLTIVIHAAGETLSRIPIGIVLDKKIITSETLIAVSMTFSAAFYFCIPNAMGYALALLCFVNGIAYGSSSTGRTCLIAEIGQEFIAISFGVSGFVAGILNLAVPSLIGWSRDYHGTYKYVYYVFAILQLFSAILLLVTRYFMNKYNRFEIKVETVTKELTA